MAIGLVVVAVGAACSSPGPQPAPPLAGPTEAAQQPVVEVPDPMAAGPTTVVARSSGDGDDDGPGRPVAGDGLAATIAGRYEAYWDALDAARQRPTADPAADFPELAGLATGEQLDVGYQSLIDLAEWGEAMREPDTPAIAGVDADVEHRVRIERLDGTVAEVRGCLVNDDVRYQVDGGAVVRDSVSTVLSTATMVLADGRWKLVRSRAVEIDEGVTGCWLTPDAEFPY